MIATALFPLVTTLLAAFVAYGRWQAGTTVLAGICRRAHDGACAGKRIIGSGR